MVPKRQINIFLVVVLTLSLVVGILYIIKHQRAEMTPPKVSRPQRQESSFVSRYISQVVIHPKNPDVLYATVPGQGFFKSEDQGLTWEAENKGIRNLLIFQMVVDPLDPNALYLGTSGGGIYRSEDGGSSWAETNHGLTNTTIEGLIAHPLKAGVLYAATTDGGMFKTDNKGATWKVFNQGLPPWDHNNLQSFPLMVPSDPTMVYFASYAGLFKRKDTLQKGTPREQWEATGGRIKGAEINFFVYDPRLRVFYATTNGGRLFKSTNGDHWSLVNDQLLDYSFYSIVIDPSTPTTLYAAVGSKGIIKSTDQGVTWTSVGAAIADKNVRSLAIDPQNPLTVYAGTKQDGLWISHDGGTQWSKNETFPVLDWAVLMESVQPPRPSNSAQPAKNGQLPVPKEFEKCNTCHGWSDSVLNSNWHTFWLVTPTYRDWKPTVERMKDRSKLSPEEASNILQYLNAYYGISKSTSPADKAG